MQKLSEILGWAGGRALVGLLHPDPCQGPGILAEQDGEASITSDKGLLILPEGREVNSMTTPNPFRSTEPTEKQIFILQNP